MISISLSVSSESFRCNTCKEIVRPTENISELEIHIQTIIEHSKSVRSLDKVLNVTRPASTVHCLPQVVASRQQDSSVWSAKMML